MWLFPAALGAVLAIPVAPPDPFERRTPVVQAVQTVGPAVVGVIALSEVTEVVNPFQSGRPLDPFDGFFFGRRRLQTRKRLKETGLGSGVVIDPEGYILTNHHVVAGAQSFQIELVDGRRLEADWVGADDELDIAVLQARTSERLPHVKPGASADLMIGEPVIAIGNPFGLSHTVTTGVISALHREISADNRVYHDFIQTDASINPGNSGGPLLNVRGELIGINTAIRAGAEGIGFAIPIDPARRIYENLIHAGEVQLAWIGLGLQDLTPELRGALGYGEGPGVLVRSVDHESPAEAAGIVTGDILTHLGGKPLRESGDYHRELRTYTAENTVSLSLWRSGRTVAAQVRGQPLSEPRALRMAWHLLGLRLETVEGVAGLSIAAVAPQSDAERIGLQAGDVVLQMGGRDVRSLKDLAGQILRLRTVDKAVLLVQRGRYGYYVTLPLRDA